MPPYPGAAFHVSIPCNQDLMPHCTFPKEVVATAVPQAKLFPIVRP